MQNLIRALGLALALTAAGLTAGCASLAHMVGYEQAATYDEKALLTAELAFDGALSAIEAADRIGALTQERATNVLPLVRQARTALVQARALYDANRSAEETSAGTQSALVATANLIQALIDAGILRQGGP